MPIRRALLSVSDKNGLTALAAGLHRHGIELLSNPFFQQNCGCGFCDLPFNFFRCVFRFGAVLGERFQFVVLVRLGTSRHSRFQ